LIDEVNSLPLPLQAKLLRAVEERCFEPLGSNQGQPLRARLIAASNADLEAEVAAGRFRADLYHRLNVVSFYLPPLRDRPAAVVPLAERFLREFAARNRPDVTGLSPEARAALESYPWPGNVRELRNALERAVALCAGPEVGLEDLPDAIQIAAEDLGTEGVLARARPDVGDCVTLAQSREMTELRCIEEALQRNRNNRLWAAAELGISRMALYKKIHKYGIAGRSSARAPSRKLPA
jgi:DNA-binding NtrC family response regulator